MIDCVTVSEQYVVKLSGGISSSPSAFLFLSLLRTEPSSSCVNGHSLMSNCLLIIVVIGSCVTFGVLIYIYIYINTFARVGCDLRSIFKRSLTSLNSELSFSTTGCHIKVKEPRFANYFGIPGRRIVKYIPF